MQGMEHPSSGRKMTRRDAQDLARSIVGGGGIDAVASDPTNMASEKRVFAQVQAALNAKHGRKSTDFGDTHTMNTDHQPDDATKTAPAPESDDTAPVTGPADLGLTLEEIENDHELLRELLRAKRVEK